MTADSVRTILMQYWDPIGIADVPQAQDEYDDYIPKILSIMDLGLREHWTRELIFNYLWCVETLDMALPPLRGDGQARAIGVRYVVDKLLGAL